MFFFSRDFLSYEVFLSFKFFCLEGFLGVQVLLIRLLSLVCVRVCVFFLLWSFSMVWGFQGFSLVLSVFVFTGFSTL